MFVLFNCSTMHFRWSYYCSWVQYCSPLLCDSNQWLRLSSDLSLPPSKLLCAECCLILYFQHRVERGLLNRKLMKVTVLLRELRESMRKENHCFTHERRIRLKLPNYLIQVCEEKKREREVEYTEIQCLKHELMCARFVRCSLDQCDRVAGSCCIGYIFPTCIVCTGLLLALPQLVGIPLVCK